METEQQDLRKELPDDLVAKIISMVPFPYIAKIRGVSKPWRARFSASSSLNDETTGQDAMAFQRRVQERPATNWSTYFPVCVERDFICGFERESQKWVRFPSLSFLPAEVRVTSGWRIEGVLLCGAPPRRAPREGVVYVVNLFTRRWKKSAHLDPYTNLHNPVSVWDASSGTYKVICLNPAIQTSVAPYTGITPWSAHIYDARSDVWNATALFNIYMPGSIPVHLNGVRYNVPGLTYHRLDAKLHAYHIADETLSTVELSCPMPSPAECIMRIYLVACDGKLYMIRTYLNYQQPLCVSEVDLESLRLLEVATAPITLTQGEAVVEIESFKGPISDGSNCIFFLTVMPVVDPGSGYLHRRELPGTMVAYDVHTHQWTVLDFLSMMTETFKYSDRFVKIPRVFDWLESSFQPGLNPFAEV